MRGLRCAVVSMSVVLLLAGCGDDHRASHRGQRLKVAHAEKRAPPAKVPPRLYGADGALLPSDQVIAGLEMPRGLDKALETPRHHVFTTRVPLGKVQRYFGTRLITGQVDRVGDGAVFRSAVPRGVRGGVVKLDVSILPIPGQKTRIEVVELPPPPVHPPSEAEIRARLQKDLRQAM